MFLDFTQDCVLGYTQPSLRDSIRSFRFTRRHSVFRQKLPSACGRFKRGEGKSPASQIRLQLFYIFK